MDWERGERKREGKREEGKGGGRRERFYTLKFCLSW